MHTKFNCQKFLIFSESIGHLGFDLIKLRLEFCNLILVSTNVTVKSVFDIGELPFEVAALAEPVGCVLNGLAPIDGRVVERARRSLAA